MNKMSFGLLKNLLLLMSAAHGNGCYHVNHVTKCFRPILQTTESDLERSEMLLLDGDVSSVWKMCKHFYNGQGCLEENVSKCGGLSRLDNENLELYVESAVKRGVIRLCEDPALLSAYSQYVDCFVETKNTTKACLHESKLKFRSKEKTLRGLSLEEISRRHCSTIEDLMACGYKAISRTCGHTPGAIYLDLMRRFLPKRAVEVCIGIFAKFHNREHPSQEKLPLPSLFSVPSGSNPTSNVQGVIGVFVWVITVVLAVTSIVYG